MVRVYLGQLGFVPSPYLGASPSLYVHDDAPALTLEGDAAMGLGRALASGGDLFGTGADVLILGDAEGAYVIDVAAALAGAPVQAASSAEGVQLLAPSTGSTVGQVVGGGLLGSAGLPAAWVGEGPVLHVFHSPAPGAALSPTLAVDVEQAGVTGEAVTAAVALHEVTSGSVGLALGCAACKDPSSGLEGGAVWLFTGAVVAGTADLDATDADEELYGSAAGARLGTSLAVFDDGRLAMGAPGVSPHGRVVVALDPWQSLVMDMWLVGSNNGATGTSVAVGDPNDDGVQQLATGAPEAMFGTSKLGMVRGVNDVLTPGALTSPWFMSGPGGAGAGGPRFGASLAFGDINGDLIDDVLIGAPLAVNTTQTGLLYVILGGLSGNGVANEEVEQYLDGDGDGVGGAMFVRCVLEGVLEGGDCDDDNAAVHPEQLEKCATAFDDDCEPANDDVLCDERFATAEVAPYADLTNSLWCYEAASWTIGPQGETVELEDLARMVAEETLFFDDDLAASMASGVASASTSTCGGGSGPTVTLDVITRLGSETAWANSPYKKILSDNVYDRLQEHGQGYLIGRFDDADPDAPHYVVLGGDYPGVVNGVVDLLRATEDLPTLRAPWRNQTVLDWPEVVERGARVEPEFGRGLRLCDEHGFEAWEACEELDEDGVDQVGPDRAAQDYALRYHINRLRSSLPSFFGWRYESQNDLRYLDLLEFSRAWVLHLRRRGIEVQPYVTPAPDVGATEPVGVTELPLMSIAGTQGWALPCATDDCSDSLDTSVPGYVSNAKYVLSLAGVNEGVVFGKNMVPSAPAMGSSATCTGGQVASVCGSAPCWCVEQGAVANGVALLGDTDAMVLRVANDQLSQTLGAPGRDDAHYGLWGAASFRPGRLYGVRVVFTTGGQPATVDLRPTVLPDYLRRQARAAAQVTTSATTPTVVSYVFRAPLQQTEMGAGGFYGAAPGVRLSVSGPGAAVSVLEVTVVELDGLSHGWIDHPDFGEAAVDVDDPSWVNATDALMVDAASAPAGMGDCNPATGCIPYALTSDCAGSPPYDDAMMVERFVPDPWVLAMPAQRLTRIKLDATPGQAMASGVVHPVLGAMAVDYCAGNGTITGRVNTGQHVDVFSEEAWTGELGLFTALGFYGRERSQWSGASLQDYLFGGVNGEPYAFDLAAPTMYVTVLDEQRLYNRGLAGWHDGVYRVDSPHAVTRALFCNIANAVDDTDWADADTPYFGYCDAFAHDGRDCFLHLTTPSLHEDGGCDLDRPDHADSSGVRVMIDSGQHRDHSVSDFRADVHMPLGSLSSRSFTAEVDAEQPSVPGSWTLARNVASNVDSRVWSYPVDKQDVYEGVCDVADAGDVLLDQPRLTGAYDLTTASLNACMMTSYAEGRVHGHSTVGSPEATRSWSTLAAGHPELVSQVNTMHFGINRDEDWPLDANPWWAHAARCMWNPGWRTVAAVSMATAKAQTGASRFCEPGTAWASAWQAPAGPVRLSVPAEAFHAMDGKDALYTAGEWHLLAMRPEAGSMVPLPDGAEGRLLGVEVAVSVDPPDGLARDACTVARALVEGEHDLNPSGVLALSGPVTGGIWFADASGQVLDAAGVAVTPTPSCNLVAGPSVMGTSPVAIRPALTNVAGSFIASARWTAVVPVGAVSAGAWVRVPGCVGEPLCRPSTGPWSFELAAGADPQVAPAYAGDDDAFPLSGLVPLAHEPSLPPSCEDARWYLRRALDAYVIAEDVGSEDPSVQEACFEEAADNWQP